MITLAVIGVWFLVVTFMAIIFACGVLVNKILNTDKYERWHIVAIIMIILFIEVPPLITYGIYTICLK
jgi:hypothetical protein